MKRTLLLTALASMLATGILTAKAHFGFGFNVNVPVYQPVRHTTIIEQPFYEDAYIIRRRPVRVIHTRPVVRRVVYQPRPSVGFAFGFGHCLNFCF